jgi:sulfur carrier protein ThiS
MQAFPFAPCWKFSEARTAFFHSPACAATLFSCTYLMQLTVKLFAYFRDNRFKQQLMEFPDNTSVEEIILSLGVPVDEVGVTMINSRHCQLGQIPKEGDQLAIFPAIGGG